MCLVLNCGFSEIFEIYFVVFVHFVSMCVKSCTQLCERNRQFLPVLHCLYGDTFGFFVLFLVDCNLDK